MPRFTADVTVTYTRSFLDIEAPDEAAALESLPSLPQFDCWDRDVQYELERLEEEDDNDCPEGYVPLDQPTPPADPCQDGRGYVPLSEPNGYQPY
jgi:hypothetical protein